MDGEKIEEIVQKHEARRRRTVQIAKRAMKQARDLRVEREELESQRDELESEVNRLHSEVNDIETEHLELAGILADIVDVMHGERSCEEYGYGDLVGDVKRLKRECDKAQTEVEKLWTCLAASEQRTVRMCEQARNFELECAEARAEIEREREEKIEAWISRDEALAEEERLRGECERLQKDGGGDE